MFQTKIFYNLQKLTTMMNNQLLALKKVASIGEDIGLELGTQFIKDYQVANPADAQYYVIGRNILDEILSQPGCVGIRFYNAYNEMGEKTFVYVGLDGDGKGIVEYTCINNEGQLEPHKGIVADRIKRGDNGRDSLEEESWNWIFD
jgi:hypothetical protein